MRYAMKYTFMDEILHGQVLMKHYSQGVLLPGRRPSDLMTLIPRAHCKTTFASSLLTQEILNEPDIAIAVVSGTEKLAKMIAKLIADTLTDNPILQYAFPEILPNANNPANNWGIRGYYLPNRSARTDPTLVVGSVTSNVTGTHPDILLFDDIIFSRKEADLEASKSCFIDAMGLMPPEGRVFINGTRWTDRDIYGSILEGDYEGNLGPYETMLMGCWANPEETIPVYDKRFRVKGAKISGFSKEDLERKKRNDVQFFNCQYLNDPSPPKDQILKVADLQIYKPKDLPVYKKAVGVGVEVVGNSVTFPALFRKVCREYSVSIYLQEISPKKEARGVKDENKLRRVLTALSPIISNKDLYVQEWMVDEKGANRFGLGYEIRKFKSAKYNDIIDALHMIPMYMSGGVLPEKQQPAQLYISADLAFTNNQDSDWTVFMAVCIDSHGHHWVIDYKRFREEDPTIIAQELIKFFQKINKNAIEVRYNIRQVGKFAKSYS